MTTCGSSSKRGPTAAGRSGFTLLEVISVMAIMILLIAVTAFAYKEVGDKHLALEPRNELVRLSKLGVRAATLQGRGFAITFDKTGFALVGLENAENTSYQLPKGIKLSLRRWGQTQWEPAEGQRWKIGSQGLCEPLRIRIEAPDSQIELKFNPLTGSPSEELTDLAES